MQGCSSLEGAFAELGQLLVNHDTPSNLVLNPFSWTTISNMLFIEAPTCVGYSYGDSAGDCSHNDTSQAQDNYGALQAFFAGYPEFAANDFYITGESYAGIYVPTLAKAVVQGNAAGAGVHINLKGIAVGNGCLGNAAGQCAFDNGVELNTNVPYFAGHGLISTDTYKAFQAACPVGTPMAGPHGDVLILARAGNAFSARCEAVSGERASPAPKTRTMGPPEEGPRTVESAVTLGAAR